MKLPIRIQETVLDRTYTRIKRAQFFLLRRILNLVRHLFCEQLCQQSSFEILLVF